MNELINNRYEKKYILTESQCKAFHQLVNIHLQKDPYMPKDDVYHVYNLYFDTSDYSFIRHSLDRPVFKDKFRLRTYHMPVSAHELVFLEIKKKFKGLVNKRRIEIRYDVANNYLMHGLAPTFDTPIDQQVFHEIDYLIKREGQLSPKVFIAYDRIAYLNQEDSMRITFDNNIRFRTTNLNLSSDESIPVLADTKGCLMEIKSTQNFPLWLVNALSKSNVYSQRFSKYGKTYQHILKGGQTYDYLFLDDLA